MKLATCLFALTTLVISVQSNNDNAVRLRANRIGEVYSDLFNEDLRFLISELSLSMSMPTTTPPVPEPTQPPVPSPTNPPTPKPSLPPIPTTDPPTSEPTSPPTLTPPSDPPSDPPSPVPTPEPTPSPTTIPSCENRKTAYAYCEGISTCFINNTIPDDGKGGKGPWGWSIDIGAVNLSTPLTCPLYEGAGQCDIDNKGTTVGSLIIAKNSVTWDFDGYGAETFHLYAGECPANDKGLHLKTGACIAEDMAQFARAPGKYSLTAPDGDGKYYPPLPNFVFDNTNHDDPAYRKGIWDDEDYLIFPLSGAGRRYLSAHSTVCPESGPMPLEGSASKSAGSNDSSVHPAAVTIPAGLVAAAALVAVGLFVARRRMFAADSNEQSSLSSASV